MRSAGAASTRHCLSDEPLSDFLVRFWGVRGSLPSPGKRTWIYGGNTPCVEVRCGDELLIFDCGTGARALGEALPSPVRATIFFSHYHHDHIQGLPFFTPLFDSRNSFLICGPTRAGRTVGEILAGHLAQPYFPVAARNLLKAQVEYVLIGETTRLQLGEARVSALKLDHPGGSLAYRVDYRNRSVVYATDVEHDANCDDRRLVEFAQGADLLIHDAMYTEDEYFGRSGPARIGWGHSTWEAATRIANRASVKKLVLFHHAPSRDDANLELLVRAAQKLRPEVVGARENLLLEL